MGQSLLAGVIGDHDPRVQGYEVICEALGHAAAPLSLDVETRWITSAALCAGTAGDLAEYDALWCGPSGPYHRVSGALAAIRFARERGVPFLGTCAGFQHAVIEYARSVLGLEHADHAESNPGAAEPVIVALLHPLMERTGAVVLNPASRAANMYRRTTVAERYRCNFGLNPDYIALLHRAGLRIAGVDEDGVAAVVECPEHPFFVATLFMPERTSRAGAPHPLITAYLRAAAKLAS